ncbi:MAG: radical SAM protein [Myxococcota bacterium]
MYPFVTVEESGGAGGRTLEVLARTTCRCNHSCPFCSAPGFAEPDSRVVRACIKDAAELLPGATFSLTGGEPTLKSTFLEEARAAMAEPARRLRTVDSPLVRKKSFCTYQGPMSRRPSWT